MKLPHFFVLAALVLSGAAHAERIKDIAAIQGVRANQLFGYGLVVGLDGTGDQTTQTPFTTQSIANMLTQMGVNLPPGINMQLKNVAAVMVTADLPPFAQAGQAIDVTVSSIGNAKSLRGGTLVMAPLKGADGLVYAMAQGSLVVSGAGASANGSKVQVNHLSVGRIPAGATVERTVATALGESGSINLELRQSDFTTASRVVDVVNARFGADTARALNARVVAVKTPLGASERVAFLGAIEGLEVSPGQAMAKVIINARTGSVVMNQTVTLDPSAVSHGNLSVVISTAPVISQPAPFGRGETVVAAESQIEIRQQPGEVMMLKGGASLADVVKALNSIGATPQDLLAILQALKASGALRAELEVI
ncbi:flagellar P-ring protein precursor FlgI [Thiobacillus denitrificans ATCC 25259]|uniref:Flagellar P-ring protein n=1 Tax=Thiobacillus denitrificans (strain ATCC 25259 / T1) TaxID=292415 RepID=FLGI_THIDA|nr:flagellar basal body P-ring protein FlgI [Thiobacillus denitrificans]Q3SIE5.1 RecName: Full=Flagellar P-ring protein; AltName: Full=Basal body P-ring protein; Flags: Precursor [Thiobacillus denitrificans ATCC 25259]AAZ97583.1 flagellar P-ring protein precursor FlgI [Thiobacillus denitrificans ATCC 25259]